MILLQVLGQVPVAVVHLPALRADELDDVGRVGGDLGWRAGRLRLPGSPVPRSPESAPELRGRERRLKRSNKPIMTERRREG